MFTLVIFGVSFGLSRMHGQARAKLNLHASQPASELACRSERYQSSHLNLSETVEYISKCVAQISKQTVFGYQPDIFLLTIVPVMNESFWLVQRNLLIHCAIFMFQADQIQILKMNITSVRLTMNYM